MMLLKYVAIRKDQCFGKEKRNFLVILVDCPLCVQKENCVSIQTPVSVKTSCVRGVPMDTAIRNFL